jgi:hypothetical protein
MIIKKIKNKNYLPIKYNNNQIPSLFSSTASHEGKEIINLPISILSI